MSQNAEAPGSVAADPRAPQSSNNGGGEAAVFFFEDSTPPHAASSLKALIVACLAWLFENFPALAIALARVIGTCWRGFKEA